MRCTREEDSIAPIRAVCCPFCATWVAVNDFSVVETMWMHEYDCDALTKLALEPEGAEPAFEPQAAEPAAAELPAAAAAVA